LQVGPIKLAGVLAWLAWGFINIAFLTGLRNRVSTVATWLATIACASCYHRAFMLGSASAPEQRCTWTTDDQLQLPPAPRQRPGSAGH
jgi:NADH dehydrogenase